MWIALTACRRRTADSGFRVVAAQALTTLLDAHLTAGTLDKALDHGRRALDLHHATGHRHGQAHTALLLGHAFHATNDATTAARSWRAAATLFRALGAPEASDAETQLRLLEPRPRRMPSRRA